MLESAVSVLESAVSVLDSAVSVLESAVSVLESFVYVVDVKIERYSERMRRVTFSKYFPMNCKHRGQTDRYLHKEQQKQKI